MAVILESQKLKEALKEKLDTSADVLLLKRLFYLFEDISLHFEGEIQQFFADVIPSLFGVLGRHNELLLK